MDFMYFCKVKNCYFSKIIPFLLFALMLFKVSSFHAYTHVDDCNDEIENCELCDLAFEIQNTDFEAPASITVDTPLINSIYNEPIITSNWVHTSPFLRFSFFGRPPPIYA